MENTHQYCGKPQTKLNQSLVLGLIPTPFCLIFTLEVKNKKKVLSGTLKVWPWKRMAGKAMETTTTSIAMKIFKYSGKMGRIITSL